MREIETVILTPVVFFPRFFSIFLFPSQFFLLFILGVVQTPPQAPEDDEFDLSQHDGRNLAFQMKNNKNKLPPSPFPTTTTGLTGFR